MTPNASLAVERQSADFLFEASLGCPAATNVMVFMGRDTSLTEQESVLYSAHPAFY